MIGFRVELVKGGTKLENTKDLGSTTLELTDEDKD